MTVSVGTTTKLLRMLDARGNVVARWDNAGFASLVNRALAVAEPLYRHDGRLCVDKLHRITPAGRDWLKANG